MPDAFHFQYPMWFLALVPMIALLWLLQRPAAYDTAWSRVCDAHLLPYLLTGSAKRNTRGPTGLLACGWLLAVIALADPVWEQRPEPVFRNMIGRVVVLDLSNSMLSPDLKPSRLVRARYKVSDMLALGKDGQTGLVVFAGDAFTVSPLTTDTATIQALLDPLEPALMPTQGSRVDLGLAQAGELLQQAGLHQGDILLVTDGFYGERALVTAAGLHAAGYRVSVLGVGTAAGAPIPTGRGGYLRDQQGEIVVPVLDPVALQQLATAGGGDYLTISNSENDVNRLMMQHSPLISNVTEGPDMKTDSWESRGPWLVLILLPLAALVFRRGWLLVLPVTLGSLLMQPQPVLAFGWNDLWLRKDQQAARTLQAGKPGQAAQLAQDPALRGTAAYRAADYSQALAAFEQSSDGDANYNQGNALARLQRYPEAIAAYERALATQPAMADAMHNKAELERFLEQRQEQQQEQQQDDQGEAGRNEQPSGSANQQDSKEQADETGTAAAGQTADQKAGQADRQDDVESIVPDSTEQSGAETADAATEAGAEKPQTQAESERQDDRQGEVSRLTSEEQQAAEQWLRRIPDDPGGLLRRKFLYQYRQRAGSTAASESQAW